MRRVKQSGGSGGGGGGVRRIREVPHVDIAAERAFLGACLLDAAVIMQSGVVRSDFYAEQLATIWDAILHVHADGERVDTETVRAWLDDCGKLALIGGVGTLLELTDTVPDADFNARRIRKLARRRAVALAAQRVIEASEDVELAERRGQLDAAMRAYDAVDAARSPIAYRSTAELFAPIPPPRFVAPGLHLGPGRPAMWAGYGASAKTLSSQALALAVASGTPVWGHFETELGTVVHLDYEQGFNATARRYQRLCVGMGIDRARLGDRLRVGVFPAVYLDQPDAVDAYCRACEGASLVILDAFRGATPTKDENDSSIRLCLDNLTRVSERTGAAFWVLHHAGKPREQRPGAGPVDMRTGPRGSSGIFDACGSVFHVDGKGDGPRRVKQSKMPADAEGTPVPDFQLVVEDVEIAGVKTAGVRVVWAPVETASPVERAAKDLDAKLDFIADVVRANAGKSQAQIARAAGMKKATAVGLLDELEDRGRVVVQPGQRGAKHYRPTGEGGQ